jgi:hypothetical protein
MKAYWGSGGIAPRSTLSLTSALGGDVWSASRSGRFTSREGAPGTHWIGGWVGPRDVLDAVVKRKIPSLRRESNPRTPIAQPVTQCYTDWAWPLKGMNKTTNMPRMLYIPAETLTGLWYKSGTLPLTYTCRCGYVSDEHQWDKLYLCLVVSPWFCSVMPVLFWTLPIVWCIWCNTTFSEVGFALVAVIVIILTGN